MVRRVYAIAQSFLRLIESVEKFFLFIFSIITKLRSDLKAKSIRLEEKIIDGASWTIDF